MYVPTDDFATPEDEYQGLLARAKEAVTRRLDEIAYDMDRTYGSKRAAERLGISQQLVIRRRNAHKEKLMPNVIGWGDDATHTPAVRTRYKYGVAEAEAIGRTGPLAQIRYETNEGSVILNSLVDEIAPWLTTLDALRDEDTAHTAREQVTHTLDDWEAADNSQEERRLWKKLQTIVSLHQTPADVVAARQAMGARGLTPRQQEEAAAAHVADQVIARLAAEAEHAHQRAIDAAPGEVSDLKLWETPKAMGKPSHSLADMLRERLAG